MPKMRFEENRTSIYTRLIFFVFLFGKLYDDFGLNHHGIYLIFSCESILCQ